MYIFLYMHICNIYIYVCICLTGIMGGKGWTNSLNITPVIFTYQVVGGIRGVENNTCSVTENRLFLGLFLPSLAPVCNDDPVYCNSQRRWQTANIVGSHAKRRKDCSFALMFSSTVLHLPYLSLVS